MKPIDPALTPTHIARRRGGKTGLVHGPAPELPREYLRSHPDRNKTGRKGSKARAKMRRILEQRFGIT